MLMFLEIPKGNRVITPEERCSLTEMPNSLKSMKNTVVSLQYNTYI